MCHVVAVNNSPQNLPPNPSQHLQFCWDTAQAQLWASGAHTKCSAVCPSAQSQWLLEHTEGVQLDRHILEGWNAIKSCFSSVLERPAQFLGGYLQSSPSLHFGGSYTLLGKRHPLLQLKLLTGALPNIWHRYTIFVSICCPSKNTSTYPSDH